VRKKGEKVEWLTIAADKVMELAGDGNAWAVEHVANRLDGRVREQVDITTTTSVKIRYESYAEVRAALLEEGINVDQLPMLTDMRVPKEQERS
jgi:prephenate dehydratase